jgi:Secretion system C-terminal sorting domain/Reeler domain
MKQKFRLIYSLFSLVLVASLFMSYASGRDGYYAGAPNDDGTCANCHGGGSTSGNSINLSNLPTSFVAGGTYSLTLTIQHASASVGGFQIVATNGVTNTMLGSFSAPSFTRINDVNRLTHSSPQSFSGGSTSWTFDWTAPSSNVPANIVFYYVGNAANGDGGTSGDAILTGTSNTTLPIELLNFSAKMGNNKTVNLAWTTASERNNRHFNVERSVDNQKFDVIGQLKGNGTSAARHDYQFTDDAANLSNNLVYYRLQQVDFDGKTTYSKIISVDIESKATLKIYPSLAYRGAVLQVETVKNATIEVINTNGQVVQTLQKSSNSANRETNKETLNISTSDLSSGRYFVRFVGNGLVKTGSFIVL